jgi:hypothetical protein
MEISEESVSFFSLPKRQTFLLICLSTLFILYIKKTMIEDHTTAFEFMADEASGSVLALRSTLQYFSVPIIYAWKFTPLGFVLWMGCFMFGYRVTYSQCWGIVLAGEFVFFIPELIKIFWFLVIRQDTNIFEIQAFYPFSLMNLVDYEELPARYFYPFKALNIFEPVYWLVLALGIQHFAKKGMRPAWTIVLGFYVPVFILWLIFYMIVHG